MSCTMLISGPTGKGLPRQSLRVHKSARLTLTLLDTGGGWEWWESKGWISVRAGCILLYDSLSMDVSLELLEDLRIPRITELTQDCNIGLNDRKRRTSLATLADESCHYDAWLGHSLGSPKFNVLGVLFFRIKSIHIGVIQTAWMWFFFFMNLKFFLLISYLQLLWFSIRMLHVCLPVHSLLSLIFSLSLSLFFFFPLQFSETVSHPGLYI
jgi:hypothetical protein